MKGEPQSDFYDQVRRCRSHPPRVWPHSIRPLQYKSTANIPRRYEYTFVPLYLQDANMSTFRRLWPDEPGVPPQYEPHPPPYANFPTIISHVHPFCVIYNAAMKLTKIPNEKVPPLLQPVAQQILFIQSLWNRPGPSTWRNDGPPSQPPSDGDGNSHPGNSGQGSRRYSTRSSKPSQGGSDSGSQSKRGLADTDTASNKRQKRPLQPPGLDTSPGVSVSSRSLQELEDGEFCLMPQNIHAWVDAVEGVVSKGDWEPSLYNDKDIGDYRLESSREVAVLLESHL
jgi:hypothetical protein